MNNNQPLIKPIPLGSANPRFSEIQSQNNPRMTTPIRNLPSENPQSDSNSEASERISKEETFIMPSNNDGYHEQILSMLKISNNKSLNGLYYKLVPQINKGSLLMLDLSASQNDSRVKNFVEAILPDNLFKERIFYRFLVFVVPAKDTAANYYEQYCQLSIANMVMQHQIKKLLAERQDMHQKLRSQKRESEDAKANSSKPQQNEDESINSSVVQSAAQSMPNQLQNSLSQKQVVCFNKRTMYNKLEET